MPTTAPQRQERNDLSHEHAGVVTGTETIYLTARDFEAIRKEWDNPSEPTPEAIEAVRRYRSLRLSDGG